MPYSFPSLVLKYNAVERGIVLVESQTMRPDVIGLFVLLPILPGIPVPQGLPFQREGLANAPEQC